MPTVSEALRRPLRDERWVHKIGIGGLLFAVPIVNFLAFGYLMEVFLRYLKGGQAVELPKWENLQSLFVKGFFGFLILVGYIAPCGILLVLSALAASIGWLCYSLAFLAFVSLVAALVFLPAGVAIYLRDGLLSAALNPARVGSTLKDTFSSYLTESLACLALLVLAGAAWPFVTFVLFLAFAELLGTALAADATSEEAGS